MSDPFIQQQIEAKGLTAARVTPSMVQESIASEHYFTAHEGVYGAEREEQVPPDSLKLLTFCVLVLKNGYTVTGESACASPENFDADIGQQIARRNAEAKIWPLLGFQLRENLHRGR